MAVVDDSHEVIAGVHPISEAAPLVASGDHLIDVLRAITNDLGAKPGLDTLLAALVHHGSALAIRSAVVWRREEEHLRLVTAYGYEPEYLERFAWLPVTARVPCSDAVTDEVPVICADRPELFRAYPLIERLVRNTHALASLPVRRHGEVVAGMSIHFGSAVHMNDVTQQFLESIGNLVGLVLDDRPIADVLPLAVVRTAKVIDEGPDLADTDDADEADDALLDEEAPESPEALVTRVKTLERQMRNMRQVLLFLGAIANDRLDDGR